MQKNSNLMGYAVFGGIFLLFGVFMLTIPKLGEES